MVTAYRTVNQETCSRSGLAAAAQGPSTVVVAVPQRLSSSAQLRTHKRSSPVAVVALAARQMAVPVPPRARLLAAAAAQ